MRERWPFPDPPDQSVFTCRHVIDGAPILHVVHEAEGQWQFLCGGDHTEQTPVIVDLREIVSLDPALQDLAGLHQHQSARREAPEDLWRIHDDKEDRIIADVERYGWHVAVLEEGHNARKTPAFAYSIGLTATFEHPELVIVGMEPWTAAKIINVCGELIVEGARFADGARTDELLVGYQCIFRAVPKQRYSEWFGYALWYYDGPRFDVLQIVWPDRSGRFPWDSGCDRAIAQRQPIINARGGPMG